MDEPVHITMAVDNDERYRHDTDILDLLGEAIDVAMTDGAQSAVPAEWHRLWVANTKDVLMKVLEGEPYRKNDIRTYAIVTTQDFLVMPDDSSG